MIKLTGLAKKDGPLTKRISLGADGRLVSDGSACTMAQGGAKRLCFPTLAEFAACIARLDPNEAIALGSIKPHLPETVRILTKDQLAKLNGASALDLIARTSDFITYEPGHHALALLDFDAKGMPDDVKARIASLGGFRSALATVLPELAACGRVVRRSTSTGIRRTDTGKRVKGSDGTHVFVLVEDGADVERFLKTLHERCWLHDLGWMMLGKAGQLLERSIVDRMVGAPERLVFEGAPVLDPPLVQDKASRQPEATEGPALDTVAACPALTILERSRLRELRAREALRLAPDSAKARTAFIAEQAASLATRVGITKEQAEHVITRQCSGVLLPDVALPFDDEELAGKTVADVLADPARFDGATLADPLEGIGYGKCKARIMLRADGSPWIHSFAHGRTVYDLRFDARAADARLEKVEQQQAAAEFLRLALAGDLDEVAIERLRNRASERSGTGRRTIDSMLKRARKDQASERAEEARQRQTAERRDPRPQIAAPFMDAPWLPQMAVLNGALGQSNAPEPPMRGLDGTIIQVVVRPVATMHLLTSRGSNEGETAESRLPAPEHPLLTRLDEPQLAELIERYIDYTDPADRSVHLAAPFVRHYLTRSDGALPVATAVATLPIVLPDGSILSGRGLDRQRGIVFRVPTELQSLLPNAADCTPGAVALAMRYLCDDWLVDVDTDYPGKCVLVTTTLSILERLVLVERPAFLVTAGQRGGGKTTAASMISLAAIGCRASAAGWSPVDEERRKSLLAYLGEGVPLICWDNLPRGAVISCPSIEKALTSLTYSDRVLGVTETRTVPATTVHLFTGNNITARGDLASRSLTARLTSDTPDPENRDFKHADPIAWTEAHRGNILRALYVVMLGNPHLRDTQSADETRFKGWWRIVGSAVEHAARQHAETHKDRVKWLVEDDSAKRQPCEVSFRSLFREAETEDEQTSALATVLRVISKKWPNSCKAAEVATYAASATEDAIEFKAALEQASGKAIKVVTPTVITWRMKAITDAPVVLNGKIAVLRYSPDKSGNGGEFTVREPSTKTHPTQLTHPFGR